MPDGLSVFAAWVVGVAAGATWRSRAFFGLGWHELAAVPPDEAMSRWRGAAVDGLAALVMAAVLGFFMKLARVDTALGGAAMGGLAWLAFTAAATIPHYIRQRRPMGLFVIDGGGVLATLMAMGAVLGWRG